MFVVSIDINFVRRDSVSFDVKPSKDDVLSLSLCPMRFVSDLLDSGYVRFCTRDIRHPVSSDDVFIQKYNLGVNPWDIIDIRLSQVEG